MMPAAVELGATPLDDDALPFVATLDRRLPVADQVYQALRDAIVTVRLLPGEAVSENRLCRHFGVSRTPARAAILRLAEEGLVDVYPQQGSFVSPIRLSGIEDARFVRRSLELSILAEAAGVWDRKASAAARAIVDSQARAVADHDLDLFFREDLRFHQTFSVLAGRAGVWDTIVVAMARLGRIVRLFARPERLPVVIEEHHAILAALDAGDAAAAAQALTYHLDRIYVMLDEVPERYRPYVVA